MNILLVNAHWNNRGDEAALCSFIDALREIQENSRVISDLKIFVIFKETKTIEEWPYEGQIEYAITRFRPSEEEFEMAIESGKSDNEEIEKEIRYVNWADVVFYSPGGAVISDRFWWEKQLEYIFPIYYAQSKGKRTFFASPSIGPFREKHNIRSRMFSMTDRIFLRESIGIDELSKEVTDYSNASLSCDLAFLKKLDSVTAEKEFHANKELVRFINRFDLTIGVTMSDLSWNVSYIGRKELVKQIEESMKGFIEWLKVRDIGVVLIPQLFNEQDDITYLKSFAQDNCYVLSDRFNSNFQQFLISKLFAVVGIRYHCNIFAAKMGIPMIPIIYEQKMQGFLKDSNMLEWGINVESLTLETLIERFNDLQYSYEARKAELGKYKPIWYSKAKTTVDGIQKCLEADDKL